MSIVLASGSPRRKQLLEMLGVKNLEIIPAVGEESAPEGLGPDELVICLARQKAEEVAQKRSADDVIIAADTIVWVDGTVYGKPHDEAHAKRMLQSLSGRQHEVYTGVCVIHEGRTVCGFERSAVCFRELEDSEIDAYIATREPMDKAGAYGAQGKAALFVKGIDGDFFNVMGLPVLLLSRMLQHFGIHLL